MSNQSGIKASQGLLDLFNNALKDGTTRVICVSIQNESLVSSGTSPVGKDWESDFDLVSQYLQPKTPCYVLYKLDSVGALGDNDWLFFCFVPDNAPVREKMLYASTRATLTKDLGDYHFKDSVYGSNPAEFTREGYAKHCAHQRSAAPLTEREKEIEELKKTEHGSDIGTETRQSHVSGVVFPVHDDAISALRKFCNGEINLVLLAIDAGERITLDGTGSASSATDVGKRLPGDAPRYAFFKAPPSLLSSTDDNTIFIYSCPSVSNIRERMLYSSCRAAALRAGEVEFGTSIKHKFELDDPSEFTDAFIQAEIASNSSTSTVATPSSPSARNFRKPAPPGRGPSRLHKPQSNE